jgi:HD-GYP domain-containing protein (c-di-GMP phosphodiesterase class II)
MTNSFWRTISADCIDPGHFPAIAVYLKSGGNYVLYKEKERPFTDEDLTRLERRFAELLYVRSDDMEALAAYLEQRLSDVLSSDSVSSMAKGKMLYQAAVNYVIELFGAPEVAANVERCRALIRHMMQYVATERQALAPLQAITTHNFSLYAHSVQMTALNLLLHERLFQLQPDEMTDVGVGSLLHDFGMTLVSAAPEEATVCPDRAYPRIREHAQQGYDFLKQTGLFSETSLTIVRHHHERYDGAGYPSGLAGGRIPRSAQLSAICDVYSSLTAQRPYRPAFSPQAALQMMREEADNRMFACELFCRFEEVICMSKELSRQERTHLLPAHRVPAPFGETILQDYRAKRPSRRS